MSLIFKPAPFILFVSSFIIQLVAPSLVLLQFRQAHFTVSPEIVLLSFTGIAQYLQGIQVQTAFLLRI